MLTPHRTFVVGVTDTYSFEVRHPDGHVIRVEKEHTPVEFLPEERAELEAVREWFTRNQSPRAITSEIPPVPDVKPAWAHLIAGERGRIWVRRHVVAERMDRDGGAETGPNRPPPRTWIERRVYDVFESDGTYLGEVGMPPRISVRSILGDTVWAVARGDFDEQYVVRYRLERGAN